MQPGIMAPIDELAVALNNVANEKNQADNAYQQIMQMRYGYEGYNTFIKEQHYFTEPGQVAVAYEIQEKPPAKVGNIIISGNDVTRDNVILRQVGLYPGQTLTYGEIAKRLGDPLHARAVGEALGRNPFAIVVPCHRVLAAGGKLGGFSANGGVVTKLRLLEIKGAQIGQEGPGLFDDLPLAVRTPRKRELRE